MVQDEILFLVINSIPVIPACPESLCCGEKDSGQAGMTLVFYFFRLLYLSFTCIGIKGRVSATDNFKYKDLLGHSGGGKSEICIRKKNTILSVSAAAA
jgi:hypothetical protein